MTSLPPEVIRCRPGTKATDRDRVALVFDYRGDRPPARLFASLKAAGWVTPAPLPPPADAIDWSQRDPESGRKWSMKPYQVSGAVAVPGPEAEVRSEADLRALLESLGLHLSDDQAGVVSFERPSPGLADVLEAGAIDEWTCDPLEVKPLPQAPVAAKAAPASDAVVSPSTHPAGATLSRPKVSPPPVTVEPGPAPSRPAAARMGDVVPFSRTRRRERAERKAVDGEVRTEAPDGSQPLVWDRALGGW